jgi:superfamily II DNA or RNA helicase
VKAHITYPIPSVPHARNQNVSAADRYVCALTSALRAPRSSLGGVCAGLTEFEQFQLITGELTKFGVPPARAAMWASDQRVDPTKIPPTVGPLTLAPYQIEAVKSLHLGGGVLALSCGLGKTAVAIAAAQVYAPKRIWILCPLNAIPTWRANEHLLRAIAPEVYIVSIDSAHHVQCADPEPGGLLIIDEAHLVGEPSARRTKAAHMIRASFDQGLCLTGTLLHGGVHKALSIQDLAVPGAARFSNQWAAGEHFHCLVKKRIGARLVTMLEKPVGPNETAFMDYLSEYVVSMRPTSDIVRQDYQLPAQALSTVKLLEPWVGLDELAADIITSQTNAGKPIPSASAVAHMLCRTGAAEKAQWALDMFSGDPLVLFANYLDTLNLAEIALNDRGLTYVRVDGSVTDARRVEAQRKFQAGEVQVFLGQMTAASTSMNLFRANISVALDHCWRSADYDQALGRTCRRGQTRDCEHYDLVANRLQQVVVERLRAGRDFDASLAEWQQIKFAVDSVV